MTVSCLLPVTGTYSLEFALQDSDGSFESILGVDRVAVTAIPAPTALLLATLGLGGLGWQRRGRAR